MNRKTPLGLLIILLLVAILYYFVGCEPDVEAPQQSISIQEADRLEELYKETRSGVLEQALGFEDTRDFWFSLDELKQYLAFVEQEAKKQGKNNLGIRVYLGAYPRQGNNPNPGYATVFFVPTEQVEALPNGANGFIATQPVNQNIKEIPALNYGSGGIPPNDYSGDQ